MEDHFYPCVDRGMPSSSAGSSLRRSLDQVAVAGLGQQHHVGTSGVELVRDGYVADRPLLLNWFPIATPLPPQTT
jgi:hypothetical protein